jgi:hypothetical protein
MLRWHIHYNLLVLRMLSFASDLHWARISRMLPGSSSKGPSPSSSDLAKVSRPRLPARTLNPSANKPSALHPNQARIAQHLPLPWYGRVWTYLAYVLYPPLYIAGPIVTFNNFAAQMAAPVGIGTRQVSRAKG